MPPGVRSFGALAPGGPEAGEQAEVVTLRCGGTCSGVMMGLMAGADEAARGLDVSVPNAARMYDYFLGGKDNISQVVPAVPYSDQKAAIQARQAYYSKTASFAVRILSGPCLGSNVRFIGRVFLTLA